MPTPGGHKQTRFVDVAGRDPTTNQIVEIPDYTIETQTFEVRSLLMSTGLVRRTAGKGEHRFISTGDVGWFREVGCRLLGPEVAEVQAWSWS